MEPPLEPPMDVASTPTASHADELTAFDVDALAALAEFEIEHRRTLALQSLYQRRRRAGGVA